MPKETLSFTQLEQQYNSNVPAAVLVERNDGTITTGIYEGYSQDRAGRYDVAVDNGTGGKTLTAEMLSDEHQAQLAERLAGKPLRTELGEAAVQLTTGFIDRVPEHLLVAPDEQSSVEVQSTGEDEISTLRSQIDGLLEGLSDEDKNRLLRYSMYTTDKSDAQQRGDGDASILYGQYLGQELTSMKPEAQQVADRYHRLMTRLSALRNQ
jgi:hypothetical protein